MRLTTRAKEWGYGGRVAPDDVEDINKASLAAHEREVFHDQVDHVLEQAAPVNPQATPDPEPEPSSKLPRSAQDWLNRHPEFAGEDLNGVHWTLIDEGHTPYSRPYFKEMEKRLKPADDDYEPRVNARAIYSAPPSRDVPTASGSRTSDTTRLTLTPAMKEAAKMSGISELEYTRQLIRLRQEKEFGNYGGQP